jgi:hypothetical protein
MIELITYGFLQDKGETILPHENGRYYTYDYMFCLGELFEQGRHVQQNDVKASHCFRIAESFGHPNVTTKIETLYHQIIRSDRPQDMIRIGLLFASYHTTDDHVKTLECLQKIALLNGHSTQSEVDEFYDCFQVREPPS